MARAGAPALALRLIDAAIVRGSPPEQWLPWERARAEILKARGDWRTLAEHLERLPTELPSEPRRWVHAALADAHLALGDGERARAHLRELIWKAPDAVRKEHLDAWRRLVARSYLVDGRVDDALDALRRYRLDRGDGDDAWRVTAARILVRAGQPADAAALLAGVQGDAAAVVAAAARARVPGASAAELAKVAARAGPGARYALWAATAVLALRSADHVLAVRALEQALALRHEHARREDLIGVDGDALWAAYLALAESLGNQAKLLVGRDLEWMALAAELLPKDAQAARAVYAYLALGARVRPVAEAAARKLAESLAAAPGGRAVLAELYLGSTRIAEPADLPDAVRLELLPLLLSRGETARPVAWIEGLEGRPATVEPWDWGLVLARLRLLRGEPAAAAGALQSQLSKDEPLSRERLDGLLAVLPAFAAAGAHDAAHAVLELGLRRTQDAGLRRAILFAMAGTRAAQGRHAEAAGLYLRSAMLAGAETLDPWARQAFREAAAALAREGLAADARGLLEHVLAATDAPAEQAVLRQALADLPVPGREPRDGPR